MKANPKITFVAAPTSLAQERLGDLEKLYETVPLAEAEVVVVLGGDGFLLHTLHQLQNSGKFVYGLNCGSVGFLLNTYKTKGLYRRLRGAVPTFLHPLKMTAYHGEEGTDPEVAYAINEVSLLRQTSQAALIHVEIDGTRQLSHLVCDGILLSTAAGSTAYNFSAHGPILPVDANLLALTPISPFRPRRWRGALLSQGVHVSFIVEDPEKRQVGATADYHQVNHVRRVDIVQDRSLTYPLLFDPDHALEDRILKEQFLT